MEQLIYFGTIIVLGFFAGCLALAFQWFMHPNMIFYPYGVLLFKLSLKGQVLRHLCRALGMCRFCNGTWIGIYMYLYYYPLDIRVLFVIGITFLFLYSLSERFKDIDPYTAIGKKLNVDIAAIKDTPISSMLWTYLIIASVYSIIYLLIPRLWVIL